MRLTATYMYRVREGGINPRFPVLFHDNRASQTTVRFSIQNTVIFPNTTSSAGAHNPERFWHKFWISFKLHKPVRKTYRFKNDIFCFLITFSFSFWYLILRMPSQTRWGFYFRGKKCLKMCLKINCSVKTPWHRPSMGVARSGLWAPVPCQDFGESCFQSGIQTPSTSEILRFPESCIISGSNSGSRE